MDRRTWESERNKFAQDNYGCDFEDLNEGDSEYVAALDHTPAGGWDEDDEGYEGNE